MRKTAMISAVALAVCAMPLTAMADTTITKTGPAPATDWVDGSNLLRIEGDNGYGLGTIDGTALTDTIYGSSFYSSKGYITASVYSKDDFNTSGLFDKDGKELIPFEYGDVKPKSDKWAIAYKLKEADANNYDYQSFIGDNYYLIETADIYYIADGEAKLLGSLPRENFMDADAHGDYIAIEDRADNSVKMYDNTFAVVAEGLRSTYDTGDIQVEDYELFRDNGQTGIKDLDGNVIMEPAFQSIYDFYGDYAQVSTGDKSGLIDREGNVIIPAEYDRIERNYYGPSDTIDSPYGAAGYFGVVKDGKFGYVDSQGNETAVPTYSKDLFDVYGATAIYHDMENKTHILAADGTDTTLEENYSRIYPLEYSNGLLFKASIDGTDGYFLLDWHGNKLLSEASYSLDLSGDGQYLLVAPDYDEADLYTVDYDLPEAAPVSDAAVEAATEGEAAVEGASADLSSVKTLLDSAAALLDADAAANKAAISTLIDNAVSAVAADHADVVTILNSAKDLLAGDTIDADAVKSLLASASALLG